MHDHQCGYSQNWEKKILVGRDYERIGAQNVKIAGYFLLCMIISVGTHKIGKKKSLLVGTMRE